MTVRNIITIDDPHWTSLRKTSTSLPGLLVPPKPPGEGGTGQSHAAIDAPTIQTLIQNLIDTMQHYQGAGIAAPQIGVNLRIIVYGFDHNPRYPEAPPVPLTVLINPKFAPIGSDQELGNEGCLSVPNTRCDIWRYRQISYSGIDQDGNKVTGIATGFEARIIQHEIDHLDGILITDHLKRKNRNGT